MGQVYVVTRSEGDAAIDANTGRSNLQKIHGIDVDESILPFGGIIIKVDTFKEHPFVTDGRKDKRLDGSEYWRVFTAEEVARMVAQGCSSSREGSECYLLQDESQVPRAAVRPGKRTPQQEQNVKGQKELAEKIAKAKRKLKSRDVSEVPLDATDAELKGIAQGAE